MFSSALMWKCAFRYNETLILDIRTSKKIWKIFRFFWGPCVMWGTGGHNLFHSTPQGLAQRLHIQPIFTFGIVSPHVAVRPFEPHWVYVWLHFLLKALGSPFFQVAPGGIHLLGSRNDSSVSFSPKISERASMSVCVYACHRLQACKHWIHI